jgi:transposase
MLCSERVGADRFMADAKLSAEPEAAVRRIEIITGAERRRRWSTADKERIVAESYAGRDTVSGVARQHGLLPQQLFTWRREAKKRGAVQAVEPVSFAPVVVAATAAAGLGGKRQRSRRAARRTGIEAAPIVIEAGAILVRIGRGAEARAVEAILRALKGSA